MTASNLIYANCRVTVKWQIPENTGTWENPIMGGSPMLFIGCQVNFGPGGDSRGLDVSPEKQQYPDSLIEVFDWPNVGIRQGLSWHVLVDIAPTTCKIGGITYDVGWGYQSRHRPEFDRQITIDMGFPQLQAKT